MLQCRVVIIASIYILGFYHLFIHVNAFISATSFILSSWVINVRSFIPRQSFCVLKLFFRFIFTQSISFHVMSSNYFIYFRIIIWYFSLSYAAPPSPTTSRNSPSSRPSNLHQTIIKPFHKDLCSYWLLRKQLPQESFHDCPPPPTIVFWGGPSSSSNKASS